MKLNQNFLNELFLLLFRKKEIIETCLKHLKYEYIPEEQYKKIWKFVQNFYKTNQKHPSIGICSQNFSTDNKVLEVIVKIQNAEQIGVDSAMNQLEFYIKDCMSVEFYENFHETFLKDKDKARAYMLKEAEKINNFSIYEDSLLTESVFGGFQLRQGQRIIDKSQDYFAEYIPYSIDELDRLTGGLRLKNTACFLARSGTGKTKFLRWVGLGSARRGITVLHIQAEGSKDECLEGYDAAWTGILLDHLKSGLIEEENKKYIEKTIRDIKYKGSDIYVRAFEKFGSGSVSDVRNIALDFLKYHEKIGLIVIDYLEKLEPADKRKYKVSEETQRRLKIADELKNLALELNCAIVTATQASDIDPMDWNNKDFVMTRHNCSMAKALIDSFSAFFTFNQTRWEYDNNIARIYCEKLRFAKGNQIIKIAQNYDKDRFYDRKRTLELEHEQLEYPKEEKKPKPRTRP